MMEFEPNFSEGLSTLVEKKKRLDGQCEKLISTSRSKLTGVLAHDFIGIRVVANIEQESYVRYFKHLLQRRAPKARIRGLIESSSSTSGEV